MTARVKDRSSPGRGRTAGGRPAPRFRAPSMTELARIADRLASVDADEELVPALVEALAPLGVEDASVGVPLDPEHVVLPVELGDLSMGAADDVRRQIPLAGSPIAAAFAAAAPIAVGADELRTRFPALAARRLRRGALVFVPLAAGPTGPDLDTSSSARRTPAQPSGDAAVLILALHDPDVILDDDSRASLLMIGRLLSAALTRLSANRRARAGASRRALVARAITELLPPGDPATISERIVDLAATLTGADRTILFAREEDDLVVVATRGAAGHTAPGERIPLAGQTAVAEAARTGSPVVTGGPAAHLARFPSMADRFERAGNRGLVALPLRTGADVSGVIGLGFGATFSPSPGDIEALTAFAGAAAAALDAARLRSAEAKVRRTLEGVVGQMPLAVAVADETGRLLLVNDRVAGIWGDVLPTQRSEDYAEWRGYHEDGTSYRWDEWPLVRAIAGETVEGEEIQIERFDGGRAHTRQWAAPIRDEEGRIQGALAIVADITAEAEVAKLRDAFVEILSHELRTPITTIYGASQLLVRPSLTPAMRSELLDDIGAEADRLLRMVQNLLVLARIERGVPVGGDEPISLEQAVRRTIELERPLRPDLPIHFVVQPGLPLVSGDEGYLEQVLRNLVSNGAKYGGGELTVTLRPVPGGATIEVADRGPGFTEEEAEHVWELYWRGPRTDRSAGAGIGLFVCRRLVEAMGGTIAAATGPDGGGLVTIRLPARTPTDEEIAADAPAAGG